MKKLLFASLALAAICLSGCFVLSLSPFYTEKDLAFDPALLGSWVDAGKSNSTWHFEREGTNAYQLTIKDKEEVNLTEAHLFKIGGQIFIDMATSKEAFVTAIDNTNEGEPIKTLFPPAIPSHTIWRVAQLAPTLRVALMNYEWLAEFLEKNPTALRHHLIKQNGEGDKDKYFAVLTAETADLQKFVLKHVANTNVWGEYTELKREPAKGKEKE